MISSPLKKGFDPLEGILTRLKNRFSEGGKPLFQWTVSRRNVMGIGLAVWLMMAAGCGDSAPAGLYPVSGMVLLDEEPLEEGNIIFFPSESGSVATGGEIRDGKFSVPRNKGLRRGAYKVSITATVAEEPALTDSDEEPSEDAIDPHQQTQNVISLIPAKFNTQTELVVDVTDGSCNVFTFNLTSD